MATRVSRSRATLYIGPVTAAPKPGPDLTSPHRRHSKTFSPWAATLHEWPSLSQQAIFLRFIVHGGTAPVTTTTVDLQPQECLQSTFSGTLGANDRRQMRASGGPQPPS